MRLWSLRFGVCAACSGSQGLGGVSLGAFHLPPFQLLFLRSLAFVFRSSWSRESCGEAPLCFFPAFPDLYGAHSSGGPWVRGTTVAALDDLVLNA